MFKGLFNTMVRILRMTPQEAVALQIFYAFGKSPYGKTLSAWTPKGVVFLGFADNETEALKDLYSRFPKATFTKKAKSSASKENLHLNGTDFQIKVWETLLKIPCGNLVTYTELAKAVGKPRAVRAVGTAVGANPISEIIPCHRVIPSVGGTGKYHWGNARKAKMISSEARRVA